MLGTNDPYYDWLCILIGVDRRNPRRNYGKLTQMLHSIDFKPKFPADENRGMDGMQLRVEFMQLHGPYGSATNRGKCTMLEFLIALARRMSFLMNGNPNRHHTEYYFWVLIQNLRLDKLTDDRWDYLNGEFFVEDAVMRLQERSIERNGEGGLFPLRHFSEDQRNVEIWYQMHAWLGENCEINLSI